MMKRIQISPQSTDEELIEALNARQSEAFEVLYYRYRDWVVRLAQQMTGDESEALDILQETFSYFMSKFPGFELRAKLTTFLYPVVKHLGIAARKKRAKLQGDKEALDLMTAPPPTPNVSNQRAELAIAMQSLSTEHREVVLLRFVDDLKLEEIAQALELPIGTIKSRLHHALSQLRQDPKMKRYFE